MNDEPLHRAWRFPVDLAATAAGAPPAVDASGVIETVGGLHSIRQAITLLLATSPGERVMRPSFGCPLNRLVFAPNDETTAGLAIHYVREAIERWEPRVEVVELDCGRNPDAADQLLIELSYRVRASGETDAVAFGVDLAGGAG